jgi:hypothetical protein
VIRSGWSSSRRKPSRSLGSASPSLSLSLSLSLGDFRPVTLAFKRRILIRKEKRKEGAGFYIDIPRLSEY